MLLDGKPCSPATFSHTNPLNISEILYFNATDLKFGSSTLKVFLPFSFLVLAKCQVLNLRVGRSCD